MCPECSETMTEIGKEVFRTLELIPARTVVPVVKAPREKNIIPGSFATPEEIAHIMTRKLS